MAREYGEENLVLAVLPVMAPVVRGQFPKATLITLPIRKKRILLNVFVANILRCFSSWRRLSATKVDAAVSLRHMRDYLMNVLFFSVRAGKRVVIENQLLGNGRPVRRWTERGFLCLFRPLTLPYPGPSDGVPRELEAHRALLAEVLGRKVAVSEVWPELHAVGALPVSGSYWVLAPFANGGGKDYPVSRWAELLEHLGRSPGIPALLLTGSTDQKQRLEEFAASLPRELSGRTRLFLPGDLQQFINLLAGAECVLTVDTAAAHAATALDVRTLVLFSGQHTGTFGPWIRSPRQRWLLPASRPEGAPWHDSHRTEEIAATVRDLLAC